MTEVNKPDFLIVGAAKAGTTSLHNYLDMNPYLKMSEVKEPKYLSFSSGHKNFKGPGDNQVENNIVKSFEEYSDLFIRDKYEYLSGESSADTLYYYDKIIPLIKEIIGDPKIIIILRNPVERAFSAFNHLLRDGREKLSFEKALAVEDMRIKKNYEFIWHYKNVGLYSKSVESFLREFSNVKIILFDDLKDNVQYCVNTIFDFLNVPRIIIDNLQIFNPSGKPQNYLKDQVFKFIRNGWKKTPIKLKNYIPKEIRTETYFIIKKKLFDENLEKVDFDKKLKHKLIEFYKADIKKLEKILNKDLSNWLYE